MKRLPVALLILCSCTAEPDGPVLSADPVPFEFGRTKAGSSADDARLPEFHYLTYDHVTGNWSGEFGGVAMPAPGSADVYLPADAARVYWPEGKVCSFYAAAYNEKVPVSEEDVEFGVSMVLYSSGTSALLVLKNPGHNVDWLVARNLRQGKIRGIPLNFVHTGARIGRVSFDLSEYRSWAERRELDFADIRLLSLTVSDADEQNYVFSASEGSLFNRDSYDYRASADHTLLTDRLLGLWRGGDSFETSYYAFAGSHKLKLHIQAIDAEGNQVVDDRSFEADATLPMGADCELRIKILPDDRDLQLDVLFGIASWEAGGEGTVSE